jgi:AraC-like DNA-binding protein
MPETGATTFSDPTGYLAGFRGATINLVFTGPEIFSARLTSVSLPHLRLFSVRETRPRIAHVSLPPTSINFAFPTNAALRSIWGGVEIKPQELMFHSVSERMHQRASGANGWSIISLDPEFFSEACRALARSEITPPQIGRVLRPPRSDMIELRRCHAKVCNLAKTNPKILAHREVGRTIENEIIQALVHCLAVYAPGNSTAAQRHCATTMNRLEEVLSTNIGRQLTIPGLCKAIGVAERTLRACCLDCLGMSPSRYIRLRRLNLVHEALRNADPTRAKISEVAAHYGFSELGRFAGYYRKVFGEIPSATLQSPRANPRSLNARNPGALPDYNGRYSRR